jgi:hypothetical protein
MEDPRSHGKDFINGRIFPPHDCDNQIILRQESKAALLVIIFLSDGLANWVITSGFESLQVLTYAYLLRCSFVFRIKCLRLTPPHCSCNCEPNSSSVVQLSKGSLSE